MKTKIITILAVVMLLGVCPVQADTVWLTGHHEIIDGDIYTEIWMYNDATADMFGGDVFKLETFDISGFDMLYGVMDLLYAHHSSIIDIHGGILGGLGATENAIINLYAYDVIHHPTGGHFDRGWVEGKYVESDVYFSFDLDDVGSFSHINVVPEPATLLLLGLGAFLVRKRR